MGRIYSEPKRLKGSIILSRSEGHGEPHVSFRIIDEISGLVAFEVEVLIPDFGNMVSSPREVPCVVKHFQSENIGKKVEQKTEIVPRPGINATGEEIAKILKPYEVGGWFGSVTDATNHHNWVDFSKVKVGFVRWVDPEDKE